MDLTGGTLRAAPEDLCELPDVAALGVVLEVVEINGQQYHARWVEFELEQDYATAPSSYVAWMSTGHVQALNSYVRPRMFRVWALVHAPSGLPALPVTHRLVARGRVMAAVLHSAVPYDVQNQWQRLTWEAKDDAA
jgi:hypothetical protein